MTESIILNVLEFTTTPVFSVKVRAAPQLGEETHARLGAAGYQSNWINFMAV